MNLEHKQKICQYLAQEYHEELHTLSSTEIKCIVELMMKAFIDGYIAAKRPLPQRYTH